MKKMDTFTVPAIQAGCFEGCHYICNPELPEQAAPFFRKRFSLESEPCEGYILASGVGFFELRVNGIKAGEDVLTPPQTLYDKRNYYLTFDVKDLLHKGENTIVVTLGNGLYNCFDGMAWYWDTAPWRDRPKCMLYGSIKTGSGETVILRSGTDFETGASQITYNMFCGGETQDLTMPPPEAAPGHPASLAKSPGGVLKPCPGPMARETEPLKPAEIRKIRENTWLFDFGQNRSGWVRVSAAANERSEVSIRYGECLDENGNLDCSNNDIYVTQGRFQTDAYILDENHPLNKERPHFSYHGFQYAELTVKKGNLTELSVTAWFVHSQLEPMGKLTCSSPEVNQLFRMTRLANLSNLVNIPTDCPHREKNGWTGDAALSAQQMCFHYRMAPLFGRWLESIRDAQRPSGQIPAMVPNHWFGYNWGSGPAWDMALFELPYEVWKYQNSKKLFKENYSAMRRYLAFLETMSEDGIISFGLGDWCPPKETEQGKPCPQAVLDTACRFRMTKIAALAAELLGRPGEQCRMEALAQKIRKSFCNHFFDAGTGLVQGNCQTAQGIAIAYGLLEGENARNAAARLARMIRENCGKLTFGIIGARTVPEALGRYGYVQLAYDLLMDPEYPGCGYWIREGYTALPEHWDGSFSRNHHMFGSVTQFFVRYVAGLVIPDYRKRTVILTPGFPEKLSYAEASFPSAAGLILSGWRRKNKEIEVYCKAPRGYAVFLQLPGQDPVLLDGERKILLPEQIKDGKERENDYGTETVIRVLPVDFG